MEAVWQRKRWACFFSAWCLIVAAWLMGAPAEARTTISFWHDWGGLGGQFFEAMVEEFEREHPEIDVEIVYAGDLENKATVAIAAGASPDVIFFPRFITGKWAARSMLEPLTRFVAEKGIREEYFFPATWEEVVYHGEVWGVPFNTDARVLFYNKAVFLESGLDPEAPPRDWNDLVSYSHQVTRRRADGALERVGFVPVWGNQSLLMYIWQNGGDMFDADRTRVLLDSPEAVGALEWVDAFVEYYGWQSLQQFSSEFGDAERTPWFTGQIAMITEGKWNLHGFKEFAPYFFENELGVAPLPGNVTRATVAGGFSPAIPYGAPHVKEAETFIEWAARPENQLAFAVATGVIPADRRAGRDPYFVEDFFLEGCRRGALESPGVERLELSAELEGLEPGDWIRAFQEMRLTAVISDNVGYYEAIVRAARQAGLETPGDLSVVCLTDIEEAYRGAVVRPTAVRLNRTQVGEEAVKLLLWRLDNPDAPHRHIRVRSELFIGDSTTSAPGS